MKVFELHVNGYKHIKNKMKVSIITVVYNNVECIGAAIESVLNQDYGDIEYVIIDAESTDGTVDIIKE